MAWDRQRRMRYDRGAIGDKVACVTLAEKLSRRRCCPVTERVFLLRVCIGPWERFDGRLGRWPGIGNGVGATIAERSATKSPALRWREKLSGRRCCPVPERVGLWGVCIGPLKRFDGLLRLGDGRPRRSIASGKGFFQRFVDHVECIDPNRFDVYEFVDPERSEFTTEAGTLDATERNARV